PGPGTHPSDDCQADYNGDQTVAVGDIFSFLSDWFDGEPDTDLDGNGRTVQDIFAFLSLWFAGCP
ncbi:MAG: hypothetical protein K2Q20_08895, partial [Phycisphaerales bacterium]|nr:hypothetical protein [Phycisphaerales bacterium]